MAGGVSIGKGATSHPCILQGATCVCLYVPRRESVRGVRMVHVCGGEWEAGSGACSWLSGWGGAARMCGAVGAFSGMHG